MGGEDRVTREVTPFVDVLEAALPARVRLLADTPAGPIFEEEGRAVLELGTPPREKRVLLDRDADLYALLLGADGAALDELMEVLLPDGLPNEPLPSALHGTTLVLSERPERPPELAGVSFAVTASVSSLARLDPIPPWAVAVHVSGARPRPVEAPPHSTPVCWTTPFASDSDLDALPELFLAMGTGRTPVRELRLRVDPAADLERGRRPPFPSEVVDVIAQAVGCESASLMRELALRRRLAEKGLHRAWLAEPHHVSWLFWGHPALGLVPATDHFPVPRRSSRQDLLRGTPDTVRPQLLAYLGLLDDMRPRHLALAAHGLYCVSLHVLPSPSAPFLPNHGGIVAWRSGGRIGAVT